ncbi:hypothetical protein ACOHYD_13650, partial [Desulfobacterota bacterium M19]
LFKEEGVRTKMLKEILNGVSMALLCAACLASAGCAVVWGAAHKVVREDENSISIQYDPMLTSTVRAMILAKEHCKKYGKIAEPVKSEMPGALLGIIEETYECVEPSE